MKYEVSLWLVFSSYSIIKVGVGSIFYISRIGIVKITNRMKSCHDAQ